MKKDKWNGIRLGEKVFHDGIQNVVQWLLNIYENSLIFIIDDMI